MNFPGGTNTANRRNIFFFFTDVHIGKDRGSKTMRIPLPSQFCLQMTICTLIHNCWSLRIINSLKSTDCVPSTPYHSCFTTYNFQNLQGDRRLVPAVSVSCFSTKRITQKKKKITNIIVIFSGHICPLMMDIRLSLIRSRMCWLLRATRTHVTSGLEFNTPLDMPTSTLHMLQLYLLHFRYHDQ